jgi:hypothetical protein
MNLKLLFMYGARVEPCPLLLRPFIGLLFQLWMIDADNCGAIVAMNEWLGKLEYLEKTCLSAFMFTTHSTWLVPVLNPGRQRGDLPQCRSVHSTFHMTCPGLESGASNWGPAPVPLCSPHIRHDLSRSWIRGVEVGTCLSAVLFTAHPTWLVPVLNSGRRIGDLPQCRSVPHTSDMTCPGLESGASNWGNRWVTVWVKEEPILDSVWWFL